MRLSTHLEELQLSIFACIRCNACTYGAWPQNQVICPLYAPEANFASSAGGLLYQARAILKGQADYSQSLAELAYTCAACGGCDSRCTIVRSINPLMALSDIIRLIRYEGLQRGFAPGGRIKQLQEDVKQHGDFSGVAQPVDIPEEVVNDRAEMLLVAMDMRWESQAKMLADALRLLGKAGMQVALMTDPGSCGSSLYDFGFWDQMPELVHRKWEKIQRFGGKKLLFLDPHTQEFITNKYAKIADGVPHIEGKHISGILLDAFRQGKLRSKKNKRVRVAYHDPCRLGRGLGIYDAPRQLLAQLEGVEVVEMKRNRDQALCCGAGAMGNYFAQPALTTAKERIGEFESTQADILITACVHCRDIFADTLGAERYRVKDLVEFVGECVE